MLASWLPKCIQCNDLTWAYGLNASAMHDG